MELPSFRFLFLAFVLLCGAVTIPAGAQDVSAVKDRMAQRLGKLNELKSKGLVGENNRGFVELRAPVMDSLVVQNENTDREHVYAALAKQTGSTPEAVGESRARHIAASSAPGVWVQAEDGSWNKKCLF